MNSLEKYAAKKLLVTGLVKEAAWGSLARRGGQKAGTYASRGLPRFRGKVDVAGVGRNLNQGLVQRFAKSQARKSATPDRIAKVTRLERAAPMRSTSPSTLGLYSAPGSRGTSITPLANSMSTRAGLRGMKASMGGGVRALPRQTQMVGKAQNLGKQLGALKKRVG